MKFLRNHIVKVATDWILYKTKYVSKSLKNTLGYKVRYQVYLNKESTIHNTHLVFDLVKRIILPTAE